VKANFQKSLLVAEIIANELTLLKAVLIFSNDQEQLLADVFL